MPSASEIKAGAAYVVATVRDKTAAGLKAIQARLQGFGTSMAGIGAGLAAAGGAILAPLTLATKSAADYGSSIKDAADRTGLAAETLQELKHAAEQSGASFEDLERAILYMQRSGRGMGAEDFLRNLDEIRDSANVADAAFDRFGKSGQRLGELLRTGSAGARALMQEARRLGLVMSQDDVEAAEAFGDQLAVLNKQAFMAKVHIGSALIPTLQEIIKPLIDGAASALAWVKAHRHLAVTAAAVGVGLAVGGAALAGFGTTLIVASAGLSIVATVAGAAASALAFIVTPLGVATTAVLALGGAFALSWAKSAEGRRARRAAASCAG